MPHCDCNKFIEKFRQFRHKLYTIIPNRRDTVMDLLDALSSNQAARSPVELSLNPLFRRDYSALYKAIEQFNFNPDCTPGTGEGNRSTEETEQIKKQQALLPLITEVIPAPVQRDFYLFGLDVTPVPRPYARTLQGRTFVYQPNAIKGNKPINIGHPYSILSVLPERTDSDKAPWCIPLSAQRVLPHQKGTEVGSQQFETALSNLNLPQDSLCVLVADSDYSTPTFLGKNLGQDHVVIITRVRSNRIFYCQPNSSDIKTYRRGHPRWYGNKFDLTDETTWHPPDEHMETKLTTRSGRELKVKIFCWQQMLMRGTKQYSLYQHPFTLLRIQMTDVQGKQIWAPMWLLAIGQHRTQLSCLDIYQAYRQRFDLEHLLRFGKQRLLMGTFQTPEAEHEENWIQLTLLAYIQLWLAKGLAQHLPRPWERYLEQHLNTNISPSGVQRDFTRIITSIGTPAKVPKTRGYSSGRAKGTSLKPRTRHQVIKKDKKRVSKSHNAA